MDAESWVNIVCTLLTTAATVLLLWCTYRYVQLTGDMASTMSSALKPCVDIQIALPNHHQVRLVIVNTGGGAARNIRFDVVEDTDQIDHMTPDGVVVGFGSLEIIQSGVSYLPPGQSYQYDSGQFVGNKVPLAENGRRFVVRIEYDDDGGNQHERLVAYDLVDFNRVLFASFTDATYSIAESAAEIARWARSKRARKTAHLTLTRYYYCSFCGKKIAKRCTRCPHCRSANPHLYQTMKELRDLKKKS